MLTYAAAVCATLLTLAEPSWPQFEGPGRENHSADRGLLKSWPKDGPRLLWKATEIGEGFASVSIVGNRIYTAGNLDDHTVVTALDLDGKIVWQAQNGTAYAKQFPGSRGTPTVDGDRVYHLSPSGNLACFDATSGKTVWQINLVERFQGRIPIWGLAESVLIDGQKVICAPGGQKIAMVALDKTTGKTIWTCEAAGDGPTYSSAILVEHAGLRQVVNMTAKSAIGVAAETGQFLWRFERETPYDVNSATPVYRDGHVAISTTWGRGTTLLKLKVDGQKCDVEKVWHQELMDNEHGGLVYVDGYLYGLANRNRKGVRWACCDWKTGEIKWVAEPVRGGSCTSTYADGMLYVLGDKGEVRLQKPNPQSFELVSRFTLPKDGKGPAWARPVVLGGRLHIRHGSVLYAFDVKTP
jgi:outer membrane protein assembly factor BamB